MEQVVDGLRAQFDAELHGEDASNIGIAEGADAILGGRPGLDPRPQPVVFGGIEPGLAAASGTVRQRVDAAVSL